MITEQQLDEKQQEAVTRCIDMSINNRIVPITGEAGTGKTSIMAHVYHELEAAGYRVVLCAPTGKAAKRIHEATGIRAMTIHRLLRYPYPGERDKETGKAMAPGVPHHNKRNPLNYQVVLCDEYANVNRELHENLMFAIPPGGVVRMFGDVNQLRPIEHGKLAMKDSAFERALVRFDGVVLQTMHRTGEGSSITENGRLINKGRIPKRSAEFVLDMTTNPLNAIRDFIMDDGVYESFRTLAGQVISPSKKSWVGTYKLNLTMRNLLNDNKDRVPMPRHEWDEKNPISIAVGDKVIWTENQYDLRDVWDRYTDADEPTYENYIPVPPDKWIMNGETGVVVEVGETGVCIDVGDRLVEVPTTVRQEDKKGKIISFDPRKAIDLAYAITTHKAQGSEWDDIAYVLNKSTTFMQCRSNLYTAISRARKSVRIVTDQRSLSYSVSNLRTSRERNTR